MNRLGLCLCILFLAYRVNASTQIRSSEYTPIQEMAQGHSLSGASQLNDSLYTNPAASAFVNVYSVEADYLTNQSFGVSVLDTKTSGVGGALGFFRQHIDNYNDPMQGAKLALMGKATEYLGVGVAGKMLWGPQSSGGQKLTDADVGILGNFSFFQLGLTARNVFGGNNSDAFNYQGREVSAGGRIGWEDTLFLSVAATSKWSQVKPYEYGIGAEYVSPYYIALKGGFRTQPANPAANFLATHNFWSFGVSLNSPRLSFHYAVEFPQLAGDPVEHMFGAVLLL